MIEQTPEQIQRNLQYELKINDMGLVPTQKQSLTECLANIIGLETQKLHQIICENIERAIYNDNLPRKLQNIRKDPTILDQYKKTPNLYCFSKITLQIASQLYQTKITVYSLTQQGTLVGLIINEKGYQQNLKIARINNSYFQIKDCSYSNISSTSIGGASSNSYKLFQAFQIEAPKSPQSLADNLQKTIVNDYPKTMTQLPSIPFLTKSVSNIEHDKNFKNAEPITIKPNFDEVSIQSHSQQGGIQNEQPVAALQNSQTIGQQYNNNNNVNSNTNQEVPLASSMQDPNTHMYYYGHFSQNANFYQPHSPYLYRQSSQKNESYMNYGSMTHLPSGSISPSKTNTNRRQNIKPMEIDENQRYTGRLKFFDEAKNYGFIIMDADLTDIFVHCDDLQKAGISKQRVKTYKQSQGLIRFSFKVMSYFGKYKDSRKAVQLQIIEDALQMPSIYS